MEIQVDPALLVVNLENCISSEAAQHSVKGECMYTVAVTSTDEATMVQIPVSVHCSGEIQSEFGSVSHQQYNPVQSHEYSHISVSNDLPNIVDPNNQVLPKEASKEATQVTPDTVPDQSSLDINTLYYNDIFNYLTNKTIPDGATVSHKHLLKKRAKSYCVRDGILYYGHTKPKKVITDREEQLNILQNTHIENGTGIHLGVKKMYSSVNSFCFWRGQYMDVANYVRQCSKCTEAGESRLSVLHRESSQQGSEREKTCIQLVSGKSTKVWEKVEVTVHGPYSRTANGNEFIVTMIDPVSHWVVAQPIPDSNLSTYLASFVYDTFCLFGFAKCHMNKLSEDTIEAVQTIYEQQGIGMQEVLPLLGLPCDILSKTLVFIFSENSEQCDWVCPLVEMHAKNHPTNWDRELNKFVFQLNTSTKICTQSPFAKMFGRKPISYSEENKENADVNIQSKDNDPGIISKRRRLQSSILQCRHCEEIFTSKISFRIHQRKHTEEARRRGMLEGEEPIKPVADRERRLLKRPVVKRKQRFLRQTGSLEPEDRLKFHGTQSSQDPGMQLDIPEGRRAELRANTVAAVRKLLATTKDSRKRRGKYMKFPSEIQEEMARYAIDHGSLKTVKDFSAKLGVGVSESTIRNIVKWYQCYTPEVKEEIGRFAAGYGVEAAAAHFSERLGREVRHGLVRKFKKLYLLRYPEFKQQGIRKKNNKINKCSKGHANDVSTLPRKRKNRYSAELKEEIGCYAYDHSVPATVIHFAQKLNLNLKEHVVRRCRKLYYEKHRSFLQQELHLLNDHGQQRQQHQQQQHQHQQQHQQHQQQTSSLLPQQLQQNHGSSLPESIAPSHSQTIDILQTSLNLLNNPQLNSSATVVYNHPYQTATTVPHLQPSNHVLQMNHQQNPPLTFQSISQMNSGTNNVSTTVPLPYQHQQVPISASVIMNQNVATVQAFQQTQVYPSFNHHSESIQTTSVTVPSNGSIPLAITQPAAPSAPISQHPQHPHHSTLPTIALAVASAHSEPTFQHPSDSTTMVVSQAVPQHPILLSHPQGTATLVQHFMTSQSQTHIQPQLMNTNHSSGDNVQAFSQVLDPHHELNSDTFSQTLNTLSFDTPAAPSLLQDREVAYTVASDLQSSENETIKEVPHFNSRHTTKNNTEEIILPLGEEQGSLQGADGTSQQQDQPISEKIEESNVQEVASIIHVVVDCPVEASMGENNKEKSGEASTCNSVSKKATGRKGGRKKSSNSDSVKRPTGQKRGNYTTYSPEIRAEMGKYAAEHGSQRACLYFRAKLGHEVAESTVRGLRDKYLMKREICSAGSESSSNNEVTSLGYAPRGRPMTLGKYDEVVQECIHDLVKSGEKISSFLAITTAKQVLMQYEPHLLEENGGNIKLNITWAKSFLKRIGIKNYS